MAPHLALVYQFSVVGVGIAAFVVTVQRARGSGRDDHWGFVLFWGAFTAWLFVELLKEYLFLNIADLDPVIGLLAYAVKIDFGCLVIAAVLRYLHALAEVKGRALRNALVAAALLVSLVAIAPPWGVRFDAAARIIELRGGFWIGEVFYMAGLLYATVLAWRSFARRHRGERASFLLVLALFATGGLVESSFGFAVIVLDPVLTMGTGGFSYSSLLYTAYGLFLIAHRGLDERHEAPEPASASAVAPPGGGLDRFVLSEREREVVEMLLAGSSNKRIAERLFVSVATVKTHLYRIYRKTGVGSRFELAQLLHQRPAKAPRDGAGGR